MPFLKRMTHFELELGVRETKKGGRQVRKRRDQGAKPEGTKPEGAKKEAQA